MRGRLKLRKRAVGTIAAAVLASMAAGCGGNSQSDGLPTTKEQPKPASLKAPVELVFYALSPLTGTEEEKAVQWTSYVQKKHPHISFKFINATDENTVDKFMLSKQPVDVLFGSFASFLIYKDRELVADMTELVKQHQFDLSGIEQSYLDLVRRYFNDALPMLPVYDLRLGLYYNKDLFDKFGVAYPKDGVTWEETLATARQLTRVDSGVIYRGLAAASAGAGLAVNQYSLGYVDPKSNKAVINTDSWKRYFDTMVPLFTVPNYNPTRENMTGGAQLKMFEQGTAAMLLAFNSYGMFNLPALQLNWDVAGLPEMSDLRGVGAQPYPVYMALSSGSKHKEDAFLAISALLSAEAQIDRSSKYGVFSPLKDPKAKAAFGEAEAWKGKNVRAFAEQKPAAPASTVRAEYKTIAEGELGKAFLSVVTGEKDVNTALREAEEAADKAIAEYLAKQSK